MASKPNRQNRQATPTPTPAPTSQDTPADASTPLDNESGDPMDTEQTTDVQSDTDQQQDTPAPAPSPVIEQVADTATPKTIPEATAVLADPVPVPTTDDTAAAPSVIDPNENDNEPVRDLKVMLTAFKERLSNGGTQPEEFMLAARQASAITNHVIALPKVDVLDTLLAFFEENREGVCRPENVLQGTSTLNPDEDQKISYLFTLFLDLAARRAMPVNAAAVARILRKPEIGNYYNRRVAGIRANPEG